MYKLAQALEVRNTECVGLLSDKLLDSSVTLGIELEVEGLGRYNADVLPLGVDASGDLKLGYLNYWTPIKDGSLRGQWATEFISGASIGKIKIPLRGEQVIRALKEIDQFFQAMTFLSKPPKYSSRTSVHVHMDVTELTNEELYRVVLLTAIFEKLLYKFAGEGRWESNYCVPMALNSVGINQLFQIKATSFDSGLRSLIRNEELQKYEGLNLRPILTQGTIEYRQLEGTADMTRVLDWINIILAIRKAAIKYKNINIDNLMPWISQEGLDNIGRDVFGVLFEKLNYPGANADILEGIRVAQDIEFHTPYLTPGNQRELLNLPNLKVSNLVKYAKFNRIKPNNVIEED